MRACGRECVRACVRARMCVCVCVCAEAPGVRVRKGRRWGELAGPFRNRGAPECAQRPALGELAQPSLRARARAGSAGPPSVHASAARVLCWPRLPISQALPRGPRGGHGAQLLRARAGRSPQWRRRSQAARFGWSGAPAPAPRGDVNSCSVALRTITRTMGIELQLRDAQLEQRKRPRGDQTIEWY